MVNIKLPEAHRAEPDRATRFQYDLVLRITLHSIKNNFFGRTYQSGMTSLDPQTLKPTGDQMNEFVLFYTKFTDEDIQAAVEFVLSIREKSAQASQPAAAAQNEEEKKAQAPASILKKQTAPAKVLGIGFCVIPIFG